MSRAGASVVLFGAFVLCTPAAAADARCHTYALVVDETAVDLVDRAALDLAFRNTLGLASASTSTAELWVRIQAKNSPTRIASTTGALADRFAGQVKVVVDWQALPSSGSLDGWQHLLAPVEARSNSDRFVDGASAVADARRGWRRSKRGGFTVAVVAALGEVARQQCPKTVAPPDAAPVGRASPSDAAARVDSGGGGGGGTRQSDGVLRSLLLGLAGVVLLIATLVIAIRLRRRMGRFEQLVLLVLLALSSGLAVGLLAGQIDLTTEKKLGWGISATGGVAVFALVLTLGHRFLTGDKGPAESKDKDTKSDG